MARGRPKNSVSTMLTDNLDVDNGEVKTMKQIKQVVRVITRFPGKSDGVSIFENDDVERYLDTLMASGWELYYVAFTGMESYKEQVDAGFRMLYVLTK